MYSSISKLDRDIARSFLNTPLNVISCVPMKMRNEQNHMMMIPSQTVINKDTIIDDVVLQPHSNVQLGFPTNTNIIPMYYDVIVDTVTDYDIFYPMAKQTTKYYNNSNNDQQLISNDHLTNSRYHVHRLDELAVSIDFPYDYDSTSNWSHHSIENQRYPYEHLQPIKTVRFNDNPTWIPYSRNTIEHTSNPIDQYYFYPEKISKTDNNEQSSVRYVTTPLFWFRPVLNHNYAICIPTSRPSLHAYITSSFDPISSQFQINSAPNPIIRF
ncbi:unnamed protein product [Rotaria sp. Silwood2]|nr:unnamed protein product [Rotaria sp. Silwood2]CAF3026650.1 unnamed protein product [Rotaria sp. Silwood2]CAF3894950.1 unnamed protein product [Rotaria sp. Silwood2]CAF4188854.1 unnamed protein product [Rotaria sp. Silwood2]